MMFVRGSAGATTFCSTVRPSRSAAVRRASNSFASRATSSASARVRDFSCTASRMTRTPRVFGKTLSNATADGAVVMRHSFQPIDLSRPVRRAKSRELLLRCKSSASAVASASRKASAMVSILEGVGAVMRGDERTRLR